MRGLGRWPGAVVGGTSDRRGLRHRQDERRLPIGSPLRRRHHCDRRFQVILERM